MNNFTIINKTTALLAKRNSGKSCLLKYLVSAEIHKLKKVFVICPTEKINRFYSDIMMPGGFLGCPREPYIFVHPRLPLR